MTNLAFIIDATNYVITHWMGSNGIGYPSSRALLDMVNAFEHRHQPEKVAIVFDGGGRTFRHEAFDGYKAGRTEKADGLREQLDLAVKLCGSRAVRIPGVEADDVIATLTTAWPGLVVILSRDKDLRQLLVDGRVSILREAHRRDGQWHFDFFTAASLLEQTGLHPRQWADFQALAGESDGWYGAEGVGDKTAIKLLKAFGDLEGVKAAAADWPSSLMLARAKVKLNKVQARGVRQLDLELARRITTLRTDVELPAAVEAAPELVDMPF